MNLVVWIGTDNNNEIQKPDGPKGCECMVYYCSRYIDAVLYGTFLYL